MLDRLDAITNELGACFLRSSGDRSIQAYMADKLSANRSIWVVALAWGQLHDELQLARGRPRPTAGVGSAD